MAIPAKLESWLRAHAYDLVFAALVGVAVLPVLAFHYFPSTDGPEHLDVAAILAQRRGTLGFKLAEIFRVRTGITPYATVYAILGPIAAWSSLDVAEKVLLLGYFVGGALAFRYAAGAIDPRGRQLACLGVPFLANYLLFMGFYNFCLAILLFLVIIGIWFGARGVFGTTRAVIFAVALLGAFYTHLTAVFAAAAVLVPAHAFEATRRLREAKGDARRRVAWSMLVLPALACVPLGTRMFTSRTSNFANWAPLWLPFTTTVRHLVTLDAIVALDEKERIVALAFAVILAGALVTIARRVAHAHAVVAALVGVTILALAAPDGWTADAYIMGIRFALFAALLVALVIAAFVEAARARLILAAASALATFALVAIRWPAHARFDREIGEVGTVMEAARPGDVLVPILYAKGGRDETPSERSFRTYPLLHASSRFAAVRGVASLHNHFACTTFSPVVFSNPNVKQMKWLQEQIEWWRDVAPTFDLDDAQKRVQVPFTAILTWGTPQPDAASADAIAARDAVLADQFMVAAHAGSATLYRRIRAPGRPPHGSGPP